LKIERKCLYECFNSGAMLQRKILNIREIKEKVFVEQVRSTEGFPGREAFSNVDSMGPYAI
jgi:hypothetical protein